MSMRCEVATTPESRSSEVVQRAAIAAKWQWFEVLQGCDSRLLISTIVQHHASAPSPSKDITTQQRRSRLLTPLMLQLARPSTYGNASGYHLPANYPRHRRSTTHGGTDDLVTLVVKKHKALYK
jgi:hypothetical protein